jgi:hypothetical protein
MATHNVIVRCGGANPSLDPATRPVRVGDTVTWTVDTPTASATISFKFPALVRIDRAVATVGQAAQAVVLAAPGRDQSLGYDASVSDASWPAPKPATAELIIAVEIMGRRPEREGESKH